MTNMKKSIIFCHFHFFSSYSIYVLLTFIQLIALPSSSPPNLEVALLFQIGADCVHHHRSVFFLIWDVILYSY